MRCVGRAWGILCLVATCLLGWAAPGQAQAQPQVVPLFTDQTALAGLSNTFAVPSVSAINQAGDFAFYDRSASALFLRRAGAPTAVRVFQTGDEVPGLTGSRADTFGGLGLNSSGLLAFKLDVSLATGETQGVILTYDGTSVRKLVSGVDTAPGAGGARFERSIALVGLNDLGDVAFSATLAVSTTIDPNAVSKPTLFIIPAGGSPVRVAGYGDTPAGVGSGTFSSVSASGACFNNDGQLLFTGTITGAGSVTSGLFVGTTASVRKDVAVGDAFPSPLSGTFTSPTGAWLNNAGQVAFLANSSLWVNSLVGGNTQVVATGGTVAAPIGGTWTFGTISAPSAFDDAGDVAFVSTVTGASSTTGLFRFRPLASVDVVAYRTQAAPGTASTFQNFSSTSMNSSGTVSFSATNPSSVQLGVFQRAVNGSLASVALEGAATPLGGTFVSAGSSGTFVTRTLDSGAVYFGADVLGATADHGEFLYASGVFTVLVSTADTLPAGGRIEMRNMWANAAGNYAVFSTWRSGGRVSYVVHNLATHTNTVVVTEGDTLPGTGGGHARSSSLTTTGPSPYVNGGGTVVFNATIAGGSVTSGIFAAGPGASLVKVAVSGDLDSASATLGTPSLTNSPASLINDAGQIMFAASGALYVGTATGAAPVKIAGNGTVTTGGGTINSTVSSSTASINASGQVVFTASTSSGNRIFLAAPGTTPVKIAGIGDTSPGGGTFATFAQPVLNASGEVAFVATVTGGPGGIFQGSASATPVAIALNGGTAPSDGTFAITTSKSDVLINDQHDIVFRSNLTGGTADSGYFMRRGVSGTLQAIVRQGQSAPGTAGVFGSMQSSINNFVGEFFQLSPAGDVSLSSGYIVSGGVTRFSGIFHVKTDNTVEPFLLRGVTYAGLGGGLDLAGSQMPAWSSAGLVTYARVSGAAYSNAVVLVIGTPAITAQAADQTVLAGQNASFTAAASSTPMPTLQWQASTDGGASWTDLTNATPYSGVTSATLTVTGSLALNGNRYHVVATNTAGSTTSNIALLTVNAAPAITAQPSNATVTAGADASFTVAASGNPTPTVKWQVSTNSGSTWSDVSGATSTTYAFTTALADSGKLFHAVFTNSFGTATTNAATLTVNVAPAVTTQPTNQTVTAGATATFTAAASGTPTPTVQWQVSTNSGSTWTDISGATSTTYAFTTALADSGKQFHAVFTNSAGTATSNAATLTVNAPVSAPSATTGAATTLTLTTATLNGLVNPNGSTTTASFDYGLTVSYGSNVASTQAPGSGATAVPTSAAVTGLTCGTTYHYRVVATNSGATTNGLDVPFVTRACAGVREVRVAEATTAAGGTVVVPVTLAALGTENAVGFSLTFDPTVLTVTSVDKGSDASTATLIVNSADQANGHYGVLLSVPTGQAFAVGTRQLVTVTVAVVAGAPTGLTTRLGFGDHPVASEISDSAANALSATWATGSVTVQAVAPVVTTQPAAQAVTAGTTATFTAAASGAPTPTVQWQVSTNSGSTWTDISGATSTTYAFTTALADSGKQYHAVFTNSAGTATTNAATLTVNAPVSPPSAATGAATSLTLTTATLNGLANPNGSSTTASFDYGLTTSYGSNVTATPVPGSGATAVTVSAALTSLTCATTYHFRVVATNSGATTHGLDVPFVTRACAGGREVHVAEAKTAAGSAVVVPVTLLALGTENAVGFSLTFDPTVLTVTSVDKGSDASAATLIVNSADQANGHYGVLLSLPTGQSFAAGSRQIVTVTVAVVAGAPTGLTTPLGFGDHPVASEISDSEANALPATWATGSVTAQAVAPVVTTPPSNQTVTAGTTATFTAAASGAPTPTVQWQVSTNSGSTWSDISGATSTTYAFTTALADSGKQFHAVFTNSAGTATTTAATLTVIVAPVVTTPPSNQTVVAGTTATFTVAASGIPTPTVQWQVSTTSGSTWSDVSGATSTTYSFTTALGDSGKQFHAVFTNSAGTATSDAATLTVNAAPAAPVVTTPPSNQTVTAGATATFTAAASGTPTPTVKWQVSTNSGSTWSDISGATSTTYGFTTALADSGKQFRAVFTNSSGTATSNAATLTVNAAPVVTTQPSAQTVTVGATATFTAAASGTPTPTVQWQVSTNSGATWSDVSGATSATYAFSTAMADSGKQYHAVFTNAAGTATTNAATLTVERATPVITWANPAAIAYGTALSSTQLNATAAFGGATVDGTFVYLPAGGTVLSPGLAQTLSVTFTPTNAVDYTPATKTVTIDVTKATPVITWSKPAAIAFGTPLGDTQLNATTTVPGTWVYTPASGTFLNGGPGQVLSVAFTPTDTSKYTLATATVTIDVTPTSVGRVTGLVTNGVTSAAVSGVTVNLFTNGGTFLTSAVTDAAGLYALSVTPGTYFATTSNAAGLSDQLFSNLLCSNGLCTVTSGTPIAVVASTTTTGIDFALRPVGSLTGTVTTTGSQAGVPNVTVKVFTVGGALAGLVVTDASGVFTVLNLPTGSYVVQTVNNQGLIDQLFRNLTCIAGTCTVTNGVPVAVTAPGTTSGINFALVPGGTITGRVSDAGSLASVGATVSFYGATGTFVALAVADGGTGVFTSPGLPTGVYFAAVTSSGGNLMNKLYDTFDFTGAPTKAFILTGKVIAVTLGQATSGINFGLNLGGRITGTVTNAVGGSPLANITLSTYNSVGALVRTSTTAGDGTYTASALIAGRYYIKTSNTQGFANQAYNGKACNGCVAVNVGNPITVVGGADTTGVNFALALGATVSGTVRRDNGVTIPGIVVTAYDKTSGAPLGSATTAGSGTYAIGGLAAGSVTVKTSNNVGYLDKLYNNIPCVGCQPTAGTPITITAGSTVGSIDFSLTLGGKITGTVTNSNTSTPVGGVTVGIYSSTGALVATAVSNNQGLYTSQALMTGSYFARTTANSAGLVNQLYNGLTCLNCSIINGAPIAVSAGTTTTGIDFPLAPGGQLSGTVTITGGATVAGIGLAVYNSARALVATPLTDGSGNYAVTGLPSGVYYVQTTAAPSFNLINQVHNGHTCNGCSPVDLGDGVVVSSNSVTSINFTLAVSGSISGTVTNAVGGAALTNIGVQVVDASNRLVTSTTTAAQGLYTVSGLAPGSYYVKTSNSAGFIDQLYDGLACEPCGVAGGTAVAVTAGAVTPAINFALTAGGTIGGAVTDSATGAPVANLTVTLSNAAGANVGVSVTSASGLYEVTGLAPGTYYARTSNSQGYIDQLYNGILCQGCTGAGTPIVVTPGATVPANFSLTLGGRISGYATDATTGVPVSNLAVSIFGANGVLVTTGVTDDAGSYVTSRGLQPGTYYAQVAAATSGYAGQLYEGIRCASCSPTTGTPIAVTSGNETPNINFLLTPAGRVTGTVTDTSNGGAGAEGVTVGIYNAAGAFVASGLTSAAGTFAVLDLPPGSYFARTSNSVGYIDQIFSGVVCATCRVTAGQSFAVTAGVTTANINFALAHGGRLAGTVRNGAATPLPGVSVAVYDAQNRFVIGAVTNQNGAYNTGGMPAGQYYVLTTNNPYGLINQLYQNLPCVTCTPSSGTPVTVSGTSTTSGIDLTLLAGGRITGTVADVNSAGLSGVTVSLYDGDNALIATTSTAADGTYAFSGLLTGSYYAKTSNSLGLVDRMYDNVACVFCSVTGGTPIPVTLGSTTSGKNLMLLAGGGITGAITGSAGEALNDIQVLVYGASGELVQTVSTDGFGQYVTNVGLPPGTYYLRTSNTQGFIDKLYNNLVCISCNPLSGTPVTVAGSATTTGKNFSLVQGGQIAGTIVSSSTGLGIENLTASVYTASGVLVTTGVTNANGAYKTGPVPVGSYYVRTSNGAGYINQVFNGKECTSCNPTTGTAVVVSPGVAVTGGINFTLTLGGRVTGTVTLADGTPIPGVTVNIYTPAGVLVTSGTTNGVGSYAGQSGLRTGTYYAQTSNIGGLVDQIYSHVVCIGCQPTIGTPIAVTAGQDATGVNFTLGLGGRISGTIQDLTTSLPIPNAFANVYSSTGVFVVQAVAGSAGTYITGTLPPGSYFVRAASRQGYVSQVYNSIECAACSPITGTPVAVTANTTTTAINFSLTPGARIAGTVTDAASGAPLKNVTVTTYNPSNSVVTTTTTDSAGQFITASGLPAGTYFIRTRNTLGYVDQIYNSIACLSCLPNSGTAIVITPGITLPGINFQLAIGGAITGTVTDTVTGAPLANVGVSIYDTNARLVTAAPTDSAGTYLVGGLPVGTYFARTTNTQGYIDQLYSNTVCLACNPKLGTPISVTGAATTAHIDFAIGPGGSITGTVTGADTSLGLGNARVALYNSSGSLFGNAVTDGSGQFQLTGVPAGTYFMRTFNLLGYVDQAFTGHACAPCGILSATPVVVTPGGTASGKNFVLALGGLVSGYLIDTATNAPLAGATVSFFTADNTFVGQTQPSDASGYYAISLPAGSYQAKPDPINGYSPGVRSGSHGAWVPRYVDGGQVTVGLGQETGGITFGLDACTPPTLAPVTLPTVTIGVPYAGTITASGGTVPYTFNVPTGTLTPGLSLNASTGALGGTPMVAGTANFTVGVVDAAPCSATQAYAQFTCAVTLGASGVALPGTAGGGSFGLATTSSDCGWAVAANASWISVVGSTSGTGGSTVIYTVQANPSVVATRSGTITVADQTFTITQAAATPPVITTNPTNTTVTVGATATFTAAASGIPTPTVTWQVSTNSGSTWSDINGATSTTYAFTTAMADSGKQFHAVFTNNAGTATTNAATLTVGRATPVITWANPAGITYGTALSSTQLNATAAFGGSLVAGAFVYTPASGSVLSVGAGQTLSVTFTPTDATNYASATKTVTIDVTKATPTITWANPSSIPYGTALSGTQLNATAAFGGASVVGTFVYTPPSGTVLTASLGQTLSVTFTPTDATNYASATKTVTIDVIASGGRPTFTDDPLVAGQTTLKAVHITELRQAISTLRARYGLSTFDWTTPSLSADTSPIRAIHLVELRTALDGVFAAASRTAPSYTHTVITGGTTPLTALDISELRAAILAIW